MPAFSKDAGARPILVSGSRGPETARRDKTCRNCFPTRASIRRRRWPCRPRRRRSPTSRCSIPTRPASDALAVLDVDPASPGYGAQIARVDMPGAGDELHHFGWNACSSCLCPYSPHPHMQRRYLVVPGMRSSRIHILDTEPDPRQPRLVEGDRGRRGASARPATAARTPHTAGPMASTSTRWAMVTATVPAGSSCWIPRRSRSKAAGSRIADRSNSRTTSGGTSGTTR